MLLIKTIKVRTVIGIFMLMVCHTFAGGKDVTVHDATSLKKALKDAIPGTTILLAPGNYGNGIQAIRLSGTPENRITIAAADKLNQPQFNGGSMALHFVSCKYVTLRDIRVTGCSGNGINSDHGGSHNTPSVGMIFENITIEDIGPRGNCDALKLSGLYDFEVRNCTFTGWGGSGIDMVGCQDGIIEHCRFIGKEGFSQDNGVQAKGASERILIRQNFFHNAGQRAVNIGGSTGLQFFRSDTLDYEAKDIEVAGNHFVGGINPVTYVTSVDCNVHHNTIIHPEKWVIRVLQEMPVDRFQPCNNGVFEANLIVFDKRVIDFVNVSPNTKPETFTFNGNAWFSSDGNRVPILPVQETNGIYNVNPMLESAETPEIKILSNDPRLQNVGAHSYVAAVKSKKYRKGIRSEERRVG